MVFMYAWKKVIWILGDWSVYLPCILAIETTEKISVVLLDIYLQSTWFRLYVEVDISWYCKLHENTILYGLTDVDVLKTKIIKVDRYLRFTEYLILFYLLNSF